MKIRRHWGLGLWGMLVAVGMLLTTVTPAPAQQTARFFVNATGDNLEPITAGRCIVLTTGTNTLATLYADGQLATSQANPVTLNTTTGECTWYMPTGTTTVDVWVTADSGTYKGSRVRVLGLTRTSTKRVVMGRWNPNKVLMVAFAADTTSNNPQNSTLTLPAGALVKDVVIQTTTAIALSGLNVGTSEPGPNGTPMAIRLCSHISTITTGFTTCNPTNQVLTGSRTIFYVNQTHATAGFFSVYYLETGNDS